jgi:bifunctional enzyme CysN/CysC
MGWMLNPPNRGFQRRADCTLQEAGLQADGRARRQLRDDSTMSHEPPRREQAARLKGPPPMVVWLTGLSGAGKTTIATRLEALLADRGRHTFLLDGDQLRQGLCKDLGFTAADRVENIRRAGEVARLLTDAGLVVVAAFISPFAAEREMVRRLMRPGQFIEVFVDTPLDVAEARDPKGLYRRARAGELKDFTGIDSPYEAPTAPDLRIDTRTTSADDAAAAILARLGL